MMDDNYHFIGGFIAASHSFIPHTVDTATAEAYALRDGLLLAQQIGGNKYDARWRFLGHGYSCNLR
jgi:hypothetical protein